MPTINYESLIKQLKQQVKQLQRKEAQTKKQLQKMMLKVQQMGQSYEAALVKELRGFRKHLVKTKAESVIRAAEDVEARVKNKLMKKRDAVLAVVCDLQDRFLSSFSVKGVKKSASSSRKGVRKKRH